MKDGEAATLSQCKRLSLSSIELSPLIAKWIDQFDTQDQAVAIELLLRLRLITTDHFWRWVKSAMEFIGPEISGLFAVRKISKGTNYWNHAGVPLERPAKSLGSEDYVSSQISQFARERSDQWIDHPDLKKMRSKGIKHLVFIDDSIGSGKRVCDFTRNIFNHGTIKSWWSLGVIDAYIITLFRSSESTVDVLDSFPGSDHHRRKYPRRTKIHFISDWIYENNVYWPRWGPEASRFIDLCQKYGKIHGLHKDFIAGYRFSFSPYIFEHGAPNNIPGILFCQSPTWKPLFPNRTIPAELISAFLDGGIGKFKQGLGLAVRGPLTGQILALLTYIKSGIKGKASLAMRLSCHSSHVASLCDRAIQAGLLTTGIRLTSVPYLKSLE